MRKQTGPSVICIVVIAMLLVACGSTASGPKVVVGCASSPEQELLGQLTKLTLQDAGFQVVERFGLGTDARIRTALESGEIDICWAYTATAWESYLGHDRPIADSHEMLEGLRTDDALNGITWMAPAPARGNTGLLVTRDWANAKEVYTLTDLATLVDRIDPTIRLCAPEESLISSRGIRGLEQVYGFRFSQQQIVYGTIDQGYHSLATGECDCALGQRIPANLVAEDVIMLDDDKSFYSPSYLCLALRSDVLLDNPALEAPLRRLSSALTTYNMIELRRQVDAEPNKSNKIIKRFLEDESVIAK